MYRDSEAAAPDLGQVVQDAEIKTNLRPLPEGPEFEGICPRHGLKLSTRGFYFDGQERYEIKGCQKDCGYEVYKQARPECPTHKTPMQTFGFYAERGTRFKIMGCPKTGCDKEVYQEQPK